MVVPAAAIRTPSIVKISSARTSPALLVESSMVEKNFSISSFASAGMPVMGQIVFAVLLPILFVPIRMHRIIVSANNRLRKDVAHLSIVTNRKPQCVLCFGKICFRGLRRASRHCSTSTESQRTLPRTSNGNVKCGVHYFVAPTLCGVGSHQKAGAWSVVLDPRYKVRRTYRAFRRRPRDAITTWRHSK